MQDLVLNHTRASTDQVRYKDKGSPAIIEQVDNTVKVLLGEGAYAIAPGQATIFMMEMM